MPFKNPHPLYNVWASMRDRCHNPNNRQWNDYGGRGVSICSRWDDFHAFIEDMGPRPKGYTLDRIDNAGNYEPGNCRWASRKQQQRNQRVTRYVTIDGARYRAVDLADIAGVKTDTIIKRAEIGLPYEDVVSARKRTDMTGLSLGGKASGERQKMKTHCPHGHAYTQDNILSCKREWRRCKTCHRERERKRREAKRAHLHCL